MRLEPADRRSRRRPARPRAVADQRPGLRRRLDRDDRGAQPELRGPAARRASRGCRRSSSTTRCSPTRPARSSCAPWFDAAAGRLDPFILVLEGSVPNEEISGDGYWAAFGVDPVERPADPTCTWIDRLAPRAAAVLALGTCAAYGGIPAMRNNPTGAMGLRDYLGLELDLAPATCRSSTCPAARSSPTTSPRRCSHLALHVAGAGPDDRARRAGPARAGCSGARCSRAAAAPASPSRASSRARRPTRAAAWSSSAARGRWRCATCRSAAGSAASAAARTWAASASRARCPASPTSSCRSWSPTRWALLSARGRAVHLRAGAAAAAPPRHRAALRRRARVARAGGDAGAGYEPRW